MGRKAKRELSAKELRIRKRKRRRRLLIAEDCVAQGSVGQRVAALLEQHGVLAELALCNLGMRFIPQGTVDQLLDLCGLTAEKLLERAKEICGHGEETTGCPAD